MMVALFTTVSHGASNILLALAKEDCRLAVPWMLKLEALTAPGTSMIVYCRMGMPVLCSFAASPSAVNSCRENLSVTVLSFTVTRLHAAACSWKKEVSGAQAGARITIHSQFGHTYVYFLRPTAAGNAKCLPIVND